MNTKELVASAGEAVPDPMLQRVVEADAEFDAAKAAFDAKCRPATHTSSGSIPKHNDPVVAAYHAAVMKRDAALADARKVLAFVAAPAPAVVPDAKPEQGAGLPELVAEGLDYFEKSGDAGDKKYIAAIRQALARQQRVVDWPSGVLNKSDTLAVIKQHNAWRRGAEGPQTDPRMLGLALDAVIAALEGGRDGR